MSTATLGKRRLGMGAHGRGNSYQQRRRRSLAGGVVRLISRLFVLALLLAVVAGISLVLTMTYRWLTIHPYFDVTAVEVEGNELLGEGEIRSLAAIEPGDNSLDVNIGEVSSRLGADPWIESVTVTRVLPGTIRIQVNERKPAFWVVGEKGLAYADASGRIIDEVTPELFASLPQLVAGEKARGFVRRELPGLVSKLESGRWPFGLHDIAWIEADDMGGLRLAVGEGEPVIRVQRGEYGAGLDRVAAVMADLEARGEIDEATRLCAVGNKVWVGFSR